MYENIIELIGKEAGLTSIILVGVHGNERCGVEAIKKLLPTLNIERGKVIICYGNPRAIEENKRFIDSNLNRMFREENLLTEKEKSSYEYKRAVFLKKYLNESDALLDIHASLTPSSKQFLICEQNSINIVKYLPIKLVVSGFDDVEPGGTDYYMNKIGKIGICLECGYYKDDSSVSIAEENIIAFLTIQGNISGDSRIYPKNNIQIDSIYITKSNSFSLTKNFEDFEEVSTDQIIGIDGNTEVKAQSDGIILFARNRTQKNSEAFLFGNYKKDPAN